MVDFLKEFLFHPAETAALCPSSSHLAEAMTGSGIMSSRCVVELGPGTGAITEKIMSKIAHDSIFLALEINPVFAKKVQEKFPGAFVYPDSAENLHKYLERHNTKHCDAVISSLPWAFFDENMQKQVIRSIHQSLAKDGKMTTYAYLHGLLLPSGKRFQKIVRQNFSDVRKKIVWKNFPPAVVYDCRK